MAEKSVFILSALLVILTALFATVTFVQYSWTRELQDKYDGSQRLVVDLQTTCLQRALTQEVVQETGSDHERGKRQSLEQMLTEMMVEQEKILMSHCLNSSKLCTPGAKGDPGIKGEMGLNGTQGLVGPNGLPGLKGDTGPMGPSGVKGEMGQKGDLGNQGAPGPKGSQGVIGDQGQQGSKGEKGDVGPQGLQGAKGVSGFQGFQGPAGANGTAGPKGDKGTQGPVGPKGEQGIQGPPGPDGVVLDKDCLCIKSPKVDIYQTVQPSYALGSVVNMTCGTNITDVPSTVTWTVPPGARCTINSTTGETLTLSKLQPSQLGDYTCTVTNQYGSAQKTFTIRSNTTDPLGCDFEQGDMCLWNINKNQAISGNTLYYDIISGPTQTGNTGPGADHTLKNSKGKYLYFEASVGLSTDPPIVIQSPDLPSNQEACFVFWYNMNGKQIGSLDVVLSFPCHEQADQTLLRLSGDAGPGWKVAQIMVPVTNFTHNILFKHRHGNGVLGDTAIDDISYTLGKCQPIRFVNPGPEDINASETDFTTLDCSANSTPNPTYTWRKVGSCDASINNTHSATLNISKTEIGDSGEYICTASNGPGASAEKIFNLNVNTTSFNDTCTFEGAIDKNLHCPGRWTQSSSDDFDWTAQKGPTQSRDTGPNTDHTLQTVSGTYVYIESSSPSQNGDEAVLVSHTMPANVSACLSFYYTMYGIETGRLEVLVEDTCTHQRVSNLFLKRGDQGSTWKHAEVSIPPGVVPNDYKILIKAVVGAGYHGDTSIDDVTISYHPCTVAGFACDFESDFCRWHQSVANQFNWTRNSGSTLTNNTGPNGDHTASGNGFYAYIETSRQPVGNTATLVSPSLQAGQDYCLKFALSMIGSQIGTIQVYTTNISGIRVSQWQESGGSQLPEWSMKKVTIPAQSSQFQISIAGSVGGSHGDVAIDDLDVSPGRCL